MDNLFSFLIPKCTTGTILSFLNMTFIKNLFGYVALKLFMYEFNNL